MAFSWHTLLNWSSNTGRCKSDSCVVRLSCTYITLCRDVDKLITQITRMHQQDMQIVFSRPIGSPAVLQVFIVLLLCLETITTMYSVVSPPAYFVIRIQALTIWLLNGLDLKMTLTMMIILRPWFNDLDTQSHKALQVIIRCIINYMWLWSLFSFKL